MDLKNVGLIVRIVLSCGSWYVPVLGSYKRGK